MIRAVIFYLIALLMVWLMMERSTESRVARRLAEAVALAGSPRLTLG